MDRSNIATQNSGRNIKELLDKYATETNTPDFIGNDPVQFPRRFDDQRDIEITALLSATMAWGNRKMILRDVERLLAEMDNRPYDYLMQKAYLEFDEDLNVHRTMFGRHLRYFMNGLHAIYKKFPTLDAFSANVDAGKAELPSFEFVKRLQEYMCDSNGGAYCPQCVPANLETTALKRFNMALRWLVRDDGIVDMGLWKSIPKSKLLIPLDVHVGNTSRKLGLLSRKGNDKKSTVMLTDNLRRFNPEDPTVYDFALFGIGISGIEIE